jgi:hypothetical protein
MLELSAKVGALISYFEGFEGYLIRTLNEQGYTQQIFHQNQNSLSSSFQLLNVYFQTNLSNFYMFLNQVLRQLGMDEIDLEEIKGAFSHPYRPAYIHDLLSRFSPVCAVTGLDSNKILESGVITRGEDQYTMQDLSKTIDLRPRDLATDPIRLYTRIIDLTEVYFRLKNEFVIHFNDSATFDRELYRLLVDICAVLAQLTNHIEIQANLFIQHNKNQLIIEGVYNKVATYIELFQKQLTNFEGRLVDAEVHLSSVEEHLLQKLAFMRNQFRRIDVPYIKELNYQHRQDLKNLVSTMAKWFPQNYYYFYRSTAITWAVICAQSHDDLKAYQESLLKSNQKLNRQFSYINQSEKQGAEWMEWLDNRLSLLEQGIFDFKTIASEIEAAQAVRDAEVYEQNKNLEASIPVGVEFVIDPLVYVFRALYIVIWVRENVSQNVFIPKERDFDEGQFDIVEILPDNYEIPEASIFRWVQFPDGHQFLAIHKYKAYEPGYAPYPPIDRVADWEWAKAYFASVGSFVISYTTFVLVAIDFSKGSLNPENFGEYPNLFATDYLGPLSSFITGETEPPAWFLEDLQECWRVYQNMGSTEGCFFPGKYDGPEGEFPTISFRESDRPY